MMDSSALICLDRTSKLEGQKMPKPPSPYKLQRIANDRRARISNQIISKHEIRPKDILDGKGGDKTHGKANKYYLDLKDCYYDEYVGTRDRLEKQKYRDAVIHQLLVEDYRFLIRILDENVMYRLMTMAEIEKKVSQALREPRKAKKINRPSSEPLKTKQMNRSFIVDFKEEDYPGTAHADDSVIDDVAGREGNYQGSQVEMGQIEIGIVPNDVSDQNCNHNFGLAEDAESYSKVNTCTRVNEDMDVFVNGNCSDCVSGFSSSSSDPMATYQYDAVDTGTGMHIMNDSYGDSISEIFPNFNDPVVGVGSFAYRPPLPSHEDVNSGGDLPFFNLQFSNMHNSIYSDSGDSYEDLTVDQGLLLFSLLHELND